MNRQRLKKEIEQLVARASFSLRDDVYRLLKRAYAQEKVKRAKAALGLILENARVAKQERLAICQDTGLPVVFIEIGRGVKADVSLIDTIKSGVEAGYRKNFLRASIVNPLNRVKPSYRGIAYHVDFLSGRKGVHITLFPKGFGSENKSQLKMFNPTASNDQVSDFIVEAVRAAGSSACPPYTIGVGIGATSDGALLLAKKVLLGPLDKPNQDARLGKWEAELLKKINALRIGAMGFGGDVTALAVKMKAAPTHIAGLPVAVNISCHALRSATLKIRM